MVLQHLWHRTHSTVVENKGNRGFIQSLIPHLFHELNDMHNTAISSIHARTCLACDKRCATSRGFSLIELLVVTAIFIIISSIVLASHSRFGGQVVLENMAYDVALSVRHAQLYGIAVRRFGADTFDVGYGMHFAAATSYQLFADSLNENGIYDCPVPGNVASCELVESTSIIGGNTITSLCVRPTGVGNFVCDKTSLDILFRRPEPDAYIRADTLAAPTYEAAQIILTSPAGQQRAVIIEQTGQISVQAL